MNFKTISNGKVELAVNPATSSIIGGVKIASASNSNIFLSSEGDISINGASANQAGVIKLSSNTSQYLRGDGTWVTPPNSNSVTKLIAGTSTSTVNTAVTDNLVYLRLFDDSTHRNNIQIKGTGATTVISDANGLISINSTNTTYSQFSTTAAGLAPKSDGATTKYLRADGTWQVPPDTNTDTHYTTKAIVGTSSSTVNAATANGNTNIRIFDNNTARATINIKGTGATSVTSDSLGAITINSTNTTYSNVTSTTAGLAPASGGGTTKYLRADGTWQVPPDTNTTYSQFSTTAAGLAPKSDGTTTKYLRADGTWQVPPDTNTTYSAATTTKAGLMSAADKTAVNNLATHYVNVTGAQQISGQKTFLQPITVTHADGLRLRHKKCSSFLRNDGTRTHFLVTAEDDPDGTWTDVRPITITNATGICDINGNAATSTKATQLSTARALQVSLSSTGAPTFNGTADVKTIGVTGVLPIANGGTGTSSGIPVTNVLASGATSNGIDAVTALRVGSSASNKLFNIPAANITVEYSRDSGATWTDYGLTDTQKKDLFSETRKTNVYLGKAITAADNNVKNMLRITINPNDRYVSLNMFYLWGTTNGNTWYAKLEYQTFGNKDTTTWATSFQNQQMGGWSGNNVVYFSQISGFNRNASQPNNIYALRFTFHQTAIASSNGSACVHDIRCYGKDVWLSPNSIVDHNRLYSWDSSLNVTFPNQLTATAFNGTATKAIGDKNGADITTTYETKANAITGVAVSGKTLTFTKGNGSTVTLQTQDTNTDTHYTTYLYAGASNGNVNATTTNGNTYLIVTDNTTARSRVKLAGAGATTVTSDASGNITINSTNTNTDTHWTTKLIVGASNGTVNAATTNGNTYLRLFDNTTARESHKIAGSGATSVTSDASGNITITTPNLNVAANELKNSNILGGGDSPQGLINQNLLNMATLRSGIYTAQASINSSGEALSNPWHNIISCQHMSGNSSVKYGMLIYSPMVATTNNDASTNLHWRRVDRNTWGQDRTILDTYNYPRRRTFTVGQSITANTSAPWYKVAQIQISGSTFANKGIMFAVEAGIGGSHCSCGILKAFIRTGSTGICETASTGLAWLVNGGFNLSDFVMVVPTTANPLVTLWVRVTEGWGFRKFTVLDNSNELGTAFDEWTLFNTITEGSTASLPTGTQFVSHSAPITTDGAVKIYTTSSLTPGANNPGLFLMGKQHSLEGGQLIFSAADAGTHLNGISMDTYNGLFRLWGVPSADGTSKTGSGSFIQIDPYAATINAANYTPSFKNGLFTGEVTITGSQASTSGGNQLRFTFGNYSSIIRNDGASTYWLVTASGNQNGIWTTQRPLTINNATGVCNINGTASNVTGTVAVANGGTGATTAATARTNLGLGSVATMSTIPIANGGTGQTTAAAARNALGLGNTTGALPIANGGTGQTTAAAARNALGLGNTTGALPIANGGTAMTTNPSMLTNLGTTAAATVFQTSPRPGVTGTLPIANGGTAMTTNPSILTNLGTTAAATVFQASPRPGVTGTLPVANGGTGATTLQNARKSLFPTGIGASAKYFIGIDDNYVNGGYIAPIHAYQILSEAMTSINYKGSTVNYPWVKIASIVLPTVWRDAAIMFSVMASTSSSSGILHCHVSTNATVPNAATLVWIARHRYPVKNFVVQMPTSWNDPFVIWTKIPSTYTGVRCMVINHANDRGESGNSMWTLYDSNGEDDHTNMLATDPTGGTIIQSVDASSLQN